MSYWNTALAGREVKLGGWGSGCSTASLVDRGESAEWGSLPTRKGTLQVKAELGQWSNMSLKGIKAAFKI